MTTTAGWKLLTPREAAARLSIPVQGLYRLVHTGQLRSVRIGRQHRFNPEELDRFVHEGGES